MEVVSVINYKGGVGKTTVTANLGAELAARGRRVLLLDLDPQTSLTFSFVSPQFWADNLEGTSTIKEWFDSFNTKRPSTLSGLVFEPPRVAARINSYGHGGSLHLIPSHLGLINVDLELATELGGGSLQQAKLKYLHVHRRLAAGLADAEFDYDIALIDCPPNFNVVTKTAIVASDHVLIPAKADYLSTLGIDYLQRNLSELVHNFNEFASLGSDEDVAPIAPAVLGVVFTMLQFYAQQPVSATRPFIAQTRRLGVPVFKAYVRENKTLFADAPQHGLPVTLNDSASASQIVGELEDLATEFLQRLGRASS